MLRFVNVQKSFGVKTVLRNVGAEFTPGAYALQGPNGCGKSTLLSVLAGIITPDAGEVFIGGHDLFRAPIKAKTRLAYVPDESPIYPFMTGREFLQFVAHAKRCAVAPHAWALAERFGLGTHLDTRFEAMSLGTQKKTMLVSALIGEPAVVLMDEPCNGLDSAARAVLALEVTRMRAGAVVLMSTHDAEFVRAMGAALIAFESLAAPASLPKP